MRRFGSLLVVVSFLTALPGTAYGGDLPLTAEDALRGRDLRPEEHLLIAHDQGRYRVSDRRDYGSGRRLILRSVFHPGRHPKQDGVCAGVCQCLTASVTVHRDPTKRTQALSSGAESSAQAAAAYRPLSR